MSTTLTPEQTGAFTTALATVPTRQALTLSDYTDEMLALDALAAMDEGEWTEEHVLLSDELHANLAKKADRFWEYRLTLKRDAERAKAYAEEIASKAKRLMARVEWMDGYLLREIERSGRPSMKGELWEIRAQKNSAPSTIVDVLPDALPPEYVRVIPETREPDRLAIATAIKAGAEIPGCRLEYGKHLRAK